MSHITKKDLRRDYYRLLDALDVGSINAMTVSGHLDTFRLAAMRLSNLGLQECNGVMQPDGFMGWSEADQFRNDVARARAEARATAALEALFDAETFKRLDIEFQGDPRGPSVKVGVKGGPANIMTAW